MSDTTMDPKAIAQAVAIEVADEDGQVGDFVEAIDLGDNVTDFRFETCIRGYEGWQWSVTLYRDAELDHWTVNESSLVPTDKALRPPEWIPWKDRLLPTDLSVTDSIGTDAYNQKLSVRRAEAVKAYLVSKGIEKNRVYTEGKGEKQPVADNRTAEGRAKNRRVEIEVVGTRAN